MARPTRIDFPGAWYHVINRGIEKRLIFRSRLSVMYRACCPIWSHTTRPQRTRRL